MRRRLQIAAVLLVALLIVALAWPVLRWLWGEWRANQAYSHGPLIPLISLFLAWRQVRRGAFSAGAAPAASPVVSLALVLFGLGAVVWATAIDAFHLAALTLVPLLMGILWFLLGNEAWTRFAFPVG